MGRHAHKLCLGRFCLRQVDGSSLLYPSLNPSSHSYAFSLYLAALSGGTAPLIIAHYRVLARIQRRGTGNVLTPRSWRCRSHSGESAVSGAAVTGKLLTGLAVVVSDALGSIVRVISTDSSAPRVEVGVLHPT